MVCIKKLNQILENFNHKLIIGETKKIKNALKIDSKWAKDYCLLVWNEENENKSVSISQIPFHLLIEK